MKSLTPTPAPTPVPAPTLNASESCSKRLVSKALEASGAFKFWQSVSPWEGSGESQIYLSSDFYRPGSPLLLSGIGGPGFLNLKGARVSNVIQFRKKPQTEFDCPQCGMGNGFANIGRVHIGYCVRCRIKWRIGENLLSGWQHESESDWARNSSLLAGYREHA